jgi:hypothetical protein
MTAMAMNRAADLLTSLLMVRSSSEAPAGLQRHNAEPRDARVRKALFVE